MDEGFGAVDRVNNPAVAAAARYAGEFFAEDGIIRVEGLDATADEQFSVAVGNRNGGLVRLGFDEQTIAAIVLEDQEPGILGKLEGGLETLGEGNHVDSSEYGG